MESYLPDKIQELLLYRSLTDEYVSKLCSLFPGSSLIQISPNIPGPDKRIFPAKELHDAGVEEIRKMVFREKFKMKDCRKIENWPFFITFFVVSSDAYQLKERCLELEESHPFGRFWDIDVYLCNGGKLSREIMKHGERICFLCRDSAKACSYEMRHSHEELVAYIQKKYSDTMKYLGG
ncbi:MAG TPA: citrate lyase holo-[acyl-carrier protein] synthase [Ruminiclostridium sp.]|nr:citrate lyase holo-[acyl-carrier protein] synthase [Ruminiclostridium sp.]